MTYDPVLAIGLMSGTSADGVDVALLRTDGQHQIDFLAAAMHAYPDELSRNLIALAQHDGSLVDLLSVEREITLFHAQAVTRLLSDHQIPTESVAVAGFHGHTIRHVPDKQLTLQIGNPSLLAERTAIRVVSDFRRRDIAAGGQGAPLTPLYHAALFHSIHASDVPPEPFCVLNLGGVGNVTWISGDQILAGDSGPGCGPLDAWCLEKTGRPFDEHGQLACQGQVCQETVQRTMDNSYFKKPFPKSADRFEFSFINVSHLNAADGAATLCAITAEAVAGTIQFFPQKPLHWWLTGGGCHNPTIVRQLSERLPNVQSIATIGGRPDSLEAECFAWLAIRSTRNLPTSISSTTGARHATIGGLISSR